MKKFLAFSASFVIFITSILLIFGRFKNKILLFGDTDLTYHFSNKFYGWDNLYIWNNYFQSGAIDIGKFQAFYLKKIILIITFIINDLYLFSYLWYVLTFLFFIYTVYFLIRTILISFQASPSKIETIAITLSLIAIFNGTFIIYAGQVLFIMALSLLNLFLIYFIKNIFFIKISNRNNYSYLVLMALFFSESLVYVQIPILAIFSLIILGTFNFKFVLNYKKQLLIQLGFLSIICAALNMQWILPLLVKFISANNAYFDLARYDVTGSLEIAKFISNKIYMNELLRLKSYHDYNQIPTILYFSGYIPLFVILIGFLKSKKDYFFSSLLIFIIISIFLSYGFHNHTNYIYSFLWKYIPTFNTFRSIMKFSFMLVYGVIITLAYILSKEKSEDVFKYFILLLSIYIASAIPIYFQPQFKALVQQYSIPEYYFDVDKNIKLTEQKDFTNAMMLPQTNWLAHYDWGPENMDSINILPYFSKAGNFINSAQYSSDSQYEYNNYFNKLFLAQDIEGLLALSKYRSLKTIIYQDDLLFSTAKERIKSDRITLKNAKVVFNDKRLCFDTYKLGRLYYCQINIDNFTPLVSITKDATLIENQPNVDMFNETPLILADLFRLNITTPDKTVYFKTNEYKFLDDIDQLNRIYISTNSDLNSKRDCSNSDYSCMIFMVSNLDPGSYHVYYKNSGDTSLKKMGNKPMGIQIFDNISKSYIDGAIADLSLGNQVLLPKKKQYSLTDINRDKVTNVGYLGLLQLQGPNLVINSISSTMSGNGHFYFEKNHEYLDSDENDLKPKLEFKENNPTSYSVSVHKVASIFYLNFAQNFDKDWQLSSNRNNIVNFIINKIPTIFSNKEKVGDKIIRHHVAFGYANSWSIDPSEYCRINSCIKNNDGSYDFTLYIEYVPQYYFYFGIVISIITFILSLIYILNILYKYIIYRL